MKNTVENKAKFFAQYWGQYVLANDRNTVQVNPVNMWGDGPTDQKLEMWLVLKPLSQITDEDIHHIVENIALSRIDQEGITEERRQALSKELEAQANKRGGGLDLFDFLRSRGYALPWNGILVEEQIEFGWVKLNSEF